MLAALAALLIEDRESLEGSGAPNHRQGIALITYEATRRPTEGNDDDALHASRQ